VPGSGEWPDGCRFRTRCPLAQERCASEEPQVREIATNHYVACHFPIEHPQADEIQRVRAETS
jgi:peptide/nickel transport system ATP-binding protein